MSLEHILAKTIDIIVKYDVETENARIRLAQDPNFNLYSLYRSIDRSGHGFIVPQDLGLFLSANGFNLQDTAIVETFFTKSKDNVQKISYHNFINQLLPNSDLELKKSCMSRSNDRSVGGTRPHDDCTRKQVEKAAAGVYTLLHEQIKQIKNTLPENCQPADFTKIIYSLCDNTTGYFCYKKIKDFMESLNFQFGQSDYNYLARKLGSNQTTRISPSEFSSFLFSWKQTEEPEQEVVVGGDSHLKFNYRPFTVSQRSPVTMATPISMSAKKPANSPPQIITNLSSTNPSTTAPQIQEEQFYSPKSILPKSPRSIFSSVPSSAVKNVVITSSLASPKNYPPPVFESKYTTPSKIDLQAHQVLSEPQPDHQVPSVRSTYQRPQTTATTSVRSTYQQNYQRPQISITSAPLAKINEHRETATTVRSSHHINETPRVSALQNNNYLDAKSAQFASENLKKRDLISKSRALRIESNNTKNVSLESNNPEIKRNSHATSIFAPRKYEKEVENQRYSNYQEQPTSVRASAKPEIKTFEFPTTPSYTSSIKNINQDPYNQLSVRNSNLTDKYGLGESPFRFYSPKFSGQNPLIHQSLNLQSSKFNPKFEQSSTTSRPSQNLESKRFYEPPKVESNFYSYQNGELKYEPAPSNNRQFYKETYSKQLF